MGEGTGKYLLCFAHKIFYSQKDKLIKTQQNWKEQMELEKDFLYSFEDLQLKIGREGMFISAMTFMAKVKQRALELEEVLVMLT